MKQDYSGIRHAFRSAQIRARALLESGVEAAGSPEAVRIPVLLRVNRSRWNPETVPGFTATSTLGATVGGVANVEAIDALERDPAVIAIEASRSGGTEELTQSVPLVRGDLVHSPPIAENGEHALVAVVDGGIDPLHECFRDANGLSRIEAIWDQFDGTGPSPQQLGGPADLNFGTVHTQKDIRSYIANGQVPSKLGRDNRGHGTFVASIAAGRAVGSFAGGMAPNARLLFIRPRLRWDPGDAPSLGYSTGHVAALAYIDWMAETLDLPVVVNLSLGMNAGAHDGTSLLEAAFEDFCDSGRKEGRIVVKSAGNERMQDGHARLLVQTGQHEQLTWQSKQSHATDDTIELWFDSADDFRFRLTHPGGETTDWVDRADPVVSGNFSTGESRDLSLSRFFKDNGASRLLITLTPGRIFNIAAGTWTLEIEGRKVVTKGQIDAWIERDDARSIGFTSYLDQDMTLSIPGTARSVVAVGSVFLASTNAFQVSSFSSFGPTRDGRPKPDLAGPGENINAADANTSQGVRPDHGTSFAAPHVAGAIALVLSRRRRAGLPSPTAAQVTGALRVTAQNFGGHHHPGAGFGVLDAAALVDAFE